MLVAFGYFPGDEQQALRLANWIKELGPYPRHSILLARDQRCLRPDVKAILEQAGFDQIQEIIIPGGIDGWPAGGNWTFGRLAKHIRIEMNYHEPWLFIEPDVAPMRSGWLDSIATEHAQGGQKFTGDYVNVPDVPPHCSGIAVYPPNLIDVGAGEAEHSHELAWDMAIAHVTVPQMHHSELISHAWQHPIFGSWAEVEKEVLAFKPKCVLFHSDKSGSLIGLLRERRVEESGRPRWAHNPEIAGSNPAPATIQENASVRMSSEGASVMGGRPDVLSGGSPLVPVVPVVADPRSQDVVCDIFIKSYPPDYPWLEYCCRSIAKFGTGFRKLEIIYPINSAMPPFDAAVGYDMPIKTHAVGEQNDGYLWQQVIKLDADKYTDAPYILYMDSDTIFTCPATPKNYMESGKVIWMMTPWEKVSTPWQPLVEKFLKKPVAFEFMRRHPFITPRWLLAELRAFCEREHGVTLDSYIMSQPHREFSEFNALGAFAYEFFRDEFVWVNTEEVPPDQWPKLTVLQSWSKGGLTDEIKARYEEILGGGRVPTDGYKEETGNLPTEVQGRLSVSRSGKDDSRIPPAQKPLTAVPVLAEPSPHSLRRESDSVTVGGEARESTEESAVPTAGKPKLLATDSRGGGQIEEETPIYNPDGTVTPGISVDQAIARLAQEAQRGWFYKKRIEKWLKEAGVLPKWKRPRRK